MFVFKTVTSKTNSHQIQHINETEVISQDPFLKGKGSELLFNNLVRETDKTGMAVATQSLRAEELNPQLQYILKHQLQAGAVEQLLFLLIQ